jgi:O-methyltransferase
LDTADRYLELLKRGLTGTLHEQQYEQVRSLVGVLPRPVRRLLNWQPYRVVRRRRTKPDPSWYPAEAETMIGMTGLNTIQRLTREVLQNDVPGDLIETGVWRGGASIFMRALLAAYGDPSRRVLVADSFQGLPKPSVEQDSGDYHWAIGGLDVSLPAVKANFARYGLLDDRVVFLEGWFRDTLPAAPVERVALMRLDGDMYESTMDALQALYPKLSPGGYVIVDDYNTLYRCRQAVEDYRTEHGITEPITSISHLGGVYWRRES